jgi:hypothetical protein
MLNEPFMNDLLIVVLFAIQCGVFGALIVLRQENTDATKRG